MSKSHSVFRRRLLRAGIAMAAATAAVAATGTAAHAAAVTLTLSSSAANVTQIASGVNVSASSATAWIPAGSTPKVIFSTAACVTTYPASLPGTATDSGTLTRFSAYKGYFTAPTTLAPSATTKYYVCVFLGSTTGDALIGSSTFTISPAPSITGSLDPVSGPSSGGTVVTVTGTGFPTTSAGFISGKLGNADITTITPGTATSFSFVAPSNSTVGSALTLNIVTSTAGTITKTSAYTYYNGITVTPNYATYVTSTAPDTAIDIVGSGFTAYNTTGWGLPDQAKPHVFLTKGAYAPAGAANAYTTAPVTECQAASVIYVSDNEIICTLKLTKTLNASGPLQAAWTNAAATPIGAYTVSVVADATVGVSVGTAGASQVVPTSTFTVSAF